ncbi:hypothetical protein M0R45_020388 [Rubus argutus]|uniref:Cyclic nucleotide-binding domain-containing protein n=1 Tax=Rubus argutus TaxID=59490 RepID=A0AAW1X9J9_RUBAR
MRSQSSQIQDCDDDLELQQSAEHKISKALCSVPNIEFVKVLKHGCTRITKLLKSYYEVLGDKSIIFLGPEEVSVRRWSITFQLFCLLVLSVDPLFCYILVVNVDNKCLTLDKTLGSITIVSRFCIDFFYTIHVIVRFRTSIDTLSKEESRKDRSDDEHRAIARRRLLLYLYFTVDILVVLPFPQVVVFSVIPKINEARVFKATKPLNFIVIIQYMIRVVRICSLLREVTRVFCILTESVLANLYLIMLTSHIFGAFWYLFSIERKVECWREDCNNHGVGYCSLYCDDNFSRASSTFIQDDFCSTKAANSTLFDFGIYIDAIESGVLDSADFLHKISYCFWWGLQNLSSFGQGFKTSSNLLEIYFAVVVSISGTVIFAFLFGNIQAYLQNKAARLENLEKGQEMELWLGFRSLPPSLKDRFRQHQKYNWQESKGIDVDKYLNKLPRDLARAIRKHHCFSLYKLPILEDMGERERVLDAIYDNLKPVIYVKHSIIFQVGDPLDEMLFVTRGKLCTYTFNRNGVKICSKDLKESDFYGEELLDWVLNFPTLSRLPSSNKTVQAKTDQVQIFAVRANQLRDVVTKFWWLFLKELRRSSASSGSQFNSDPWKPRATSILQAAFRRHLKIKLQKQSPTGSG